MLLALTLEVTENKRLIPILLPSGKTPDDLPMLLRGLACVSFEKSVSERGVLDSLVHAITGQRPESAKPPPPEPVSPEPVPTRGTKVDPGLRRQAIRNLAGALASGPVTFFLGPNASPGRDDSYPPCASEVTGRLMRESELIKDCPKNPPCFPRDVACDYFCVQQSKQLLEDEVAAVIQKHSRQIPLVYEKLAGLLAKTLQTRGTTQRHHKHPQLVVTTNLDVLMERALLRQRIPFTRLVVNLTERTMEINQYWEEQTQNGPEKGKIVLATDLRQDAGDEKLDEFIRDHGRSLFDPSHRDDEREGDNSPEGPEGQPIVSELPPLDPAPVLMKYCGSVDLPGTCTLSSEQAMQIAAAGVDMPSGIGAIINNTPWLFLGYGLFDPELRLLCHTVLRESRNTPARQRDARYAVLPHPADDPFDTVRQMEIPIWENVKARWTDWRSGTHFVESRIDTFLDDLVKELSRVSGQ